MRIAQVLTYVSSDGAYGGPLAVMVAQAQQLASQGHVVEIFAGWDGHAELEVPGVRVHLYRTRALLPTGFSGLVSPALASALLRRRDDFDVVHVHLSRDLVTTTAAFVVTWGRRRPELFVQTHGMVKPDRRLLARIQDIALRRIFDRATGAFALNDVDAIRIAEVVGASAPVLNLPNGVPEQTVLHREPRAVPEFLFLARLQARKNVLGFARAARLLIDRGVSARFCVVGPDEGDLARLREFIGQHDLEDHLTYEGAVPPGAGPARLAQADVYVLPSLDEPFPMTVLEAMSVGRPCVVAASCHISEELSRGGGVVTFDGTDEDLARALQRLAEDPCLRDRMSDEAVLDVRTNYSSSAVASQLLAYYRKSSTSVAGSHGWEERAGG